MAVIELPPKPGTPGAGSVLDIDPKSENFGKPVKEEPLGRTRFAHYRALNPEKYPGKETRATRELPEMTFSGLLSNEDPVKSYQAAAAIVTATNPREIGMILESNFPNIGISEDEKGNLIANNRETGVQAVINKPGASPIDVIQALGIGSLFMPGANLASIPTTGLGKVVVGGAAAGLTAGGIESAQQAMGGEFNPEEMALATGLGGASEAIVPAVQSLRMSRLQKQAAEAGRQLDDVKGAVQIADEASDATGIDLFPAQKTKLPSDLQAQSYMPELPAGTARASKALAKQNEQAFDAVVQFLKDTAPDESVVTGPKKFRTAAQRAVDGRINLRKQKTSGLYKEAYENAQPVDITPVNEYIDELLESFPKGTQTHNEMLALKKALNPKEPLTLQQLHNIKIDTIDPKLNSYGGDSIGRTAKRNMTLLKNRLIKQLEDSNPLYIEANKAFEKASGPVTAIQESIVGKVADMKDSQLKRMAATIFDAAETDPTVVSNAKKIIQDVDPDAWNELFRVEIERRLGSVRSTMEAGSTENVPGQLFRALFPNEKQRRVLFNAVDGDAKKNLRYLEIALNRARLGRPGGSQTATREEIKRELRGGFVGAIREWIFSPVKTISGLGEDAAFNARTRALTNVLFDTEWKPRLKELRQLDIESPAAARAMFQLLDDAMSADIENFQNRETEEDAKPD